MPSDREIGLAAMQGGDVAGAIVALERAVQNDPTDHRACSTLGIAYSKSGRHTDAVALLSKAIEMRPASPQDRLNLGVAMERGGWKEQAIVAVQQALTLKPDYPQALQALRRMQLDSMPPPVPAGLMQPEGPQPAEPVPAYGYPLQQQPAAVEMPVVAQTAASPPPQQPYGQPQLYHSAPPGFLPVGTALPQTGSPAPSAEAVVYDRQGGYAGPVSVADEPKMPLAIAVGIAASLALGLIFGYLSVQVGFRIPLLMLLNGYLLGVIVRSAAGQAGQKQGVLAALLALTANAIGLAFMYAKGVFFLPTALIVLVLVTAHAYKVASDS